MAEIRPLPIVQRRDFIYRRAPRMAELPSQLADTNLATQIKLQHETMTKRGIAPELIAEQLKAMKRRLALSFGGSF